MEQGYLLPEQAFAVLGMLLLWIYTTIEFFKDTEYDIFTFVFILLPASIGVISFGLVPIAAIINIIPSLLYPNKIGLIVEAIGLYITLCTIIAFNLTNNKDLIKWTTQSH